MLHPANRAALETDFNAMWMEGRVCQNIGDNASSKLSSSLMLFEHNVYFQPFAYIFSVLSVHIISFFYSPATYLYVRNPSTAPTIGATMYKGEKASSAKATAGLRMPRLPEMEAI